MGWNIELICIRDRDLDVASAVPDVLGPTGTQYGFEDATSVTRDGELCAARIGNWIVAIDVGCRLSGFDSYLQEVSAGRDVHVFRIAAQPLHIVYRDGERRSFAVASATARPRSPARPTMFKFD